MSIPQRAQREDRRREFALWILLSAEANGQPPRRAAAQFEANFVGVQAPATASEKTEFFALERMDDHLPEPSEWELMRDEVQETLSAVELNAALIDETITKASPRWRIDRMPLVDRCLLRIGVAELMFRGEPRPRATINGLIELAKRYGEQTSPRFVNGILDQIRRNLEIPFK